MKNNEESIITEAKIWKPEEAAAHALIPLSTEMAHLIKYRYQRIRQTESWVNTIFNSIDLIMTCLKRNNHRAKKIDERVYYLLDNPEILDKCYYECLHSVHIKQTGLDLSHFPKERDPEFTLSNLLCMNNWLVNYLNTHLDLNRPGNTAINALYRRKILHESDFYNAPVHVLEIMKRIDDGGE